MDSATERWQLFAGDGGALSFDRVFGHWRADEGFRAFWGASLRSVPFQAYCWECPPVTLQNLARDFECVFVSSPLLVDSPADPRPFAEHLRAGCRIVVFESLGKDALLVAPCPDSRGGSFAHLASFVATASDPVSSALWKAVGEALEQRIGANPVWLSTAGLGVSWLHVRLDTRPKYYRYGPYRRG